MFRPAHGAGVFVHDGRGRVLLGLQRDGWTTFAGKAEPGEAPRQTALRECHEETLFVLSKHLQVSETPSFTSKTPTGRPFYLFSAHTPHDETLPDAFAQFRMSRRFAHLPGCRETRALRWFGIAGLLSGRTKVRMRPSFRAELAEISAALCTAPVGAPSTRHATIRCDGATKNHARHT